MNYRDRIAEVLTNALTGPLDVAADQVESLADWVETPKDPKMGDFAFPCFRLARLLRKGPPLIAQDLLPHVAAALETEPDLASVEAVGPYLNFRVDCAALAARVVRGVLDGSFLARRADRGERVMIEYSQPNTHKAFHVGHTRNAALGDALWRIFDWCGYDVVPANYIGDEGAHIAKCLWHFQTQFKGEIPDHNLGEFLGELYAEAAFLLDFGTLSECPMPDVVTAEVLKVAPMPGHDKLRRVEIDDGAGRFQVVCGGEKYAVGDVVAYARVGSRVGGRLVGEIDKHGVHSVGMICSEKELGFSEDNQTVYTFPKGTALGQQLAEYFRKNDAPLDPDASVLDTMRRRSEGVAATLHKLESRDPETMALWEKTKQWSMDEFHRIYDWLDVRFDHYFFESEVGERGKRICLDFYEKGVLVKSEGAIGADLEPYGMPFLLLIKSDGAGLYATKDIALAKEKFEKFGVDRSVYVVDMSQSLHFQQVFKTLELMGYEKAKNCYHLGYGLVVLPDGKMSSRKGNIILFSQLKAKLDSKITEDFLEKYRGDWSDNEIADASRRISVATIKYGMVNQDNLKNIVFDLNEWTARSGNTGPYMMYAYARTRSILREVGDFDRGLADWSLLTHETESALIALMAKFPETVERACADYRPQALCLYLFELAKSFSRMYDHCSVLRAENEALKATRALLVDAAGRLIRQVLALIGVATLDRM